MRILRDFMDGILAYPKHFKNISRFSLWNYFLFPALLGFLILLSIIFGSFQFGDEFGTWLTSWYPWEKGSNFIHSISQWIGRILIFIFGFLIIKYVVILIASPFMSAMSTKIELKLGSQEQSIVNKQSQIKFIPSLLRGLRITIRNASREIFLSILLLLLGVIIPFLSPFIAIIIFLVQCYYAGYGNMDYTLERFYSVKESNQFVRRHWALAVGNGLVFMFLLMLGIGFLIAPALGTNAVSPQVLRRLQ